MKTSFASSFFAVDMMSMLASSIKRKSTLHNLFTKEKGSLFNVKIWMKILVKKSTLCYGNENRNRKLEG